MEPTSERILERCYDLPLHGVGFSTACLEPAHLGGPLNLTYCAGSWHGRFMKCAVIATVNCKY